MPQAKLATGSAASNPVFAPVENSNSRNSSDSLATKLSKLITIAAVYIHKAVHITDAEALDRRLRVELPLWTETKEKKKLGSGYYSEGRARDQAYMVTQRPV